MWNSNDEDYPPEASHLYQHWPKKGAILLVGKGEGKGDRAVGLAVEYARKILAENTPKSIPLFETGVHPDYRIIQPEGDSEWIKIDQIRDLIQWTVGTPQIAQQQVAIISPAHALNVQAANALLKTLEDPLLNTLFILESDKPFLIPQTVRSRCYWIRFRSAYPSMNTMNIETKTSEIKDRVLNDLKMLQNRQTNPVTLGLEWSKNDPKQILYWLSFILYHSYSRQIQQGKIACDRSWWAFWDKLTVARRALEEINQPNMQLLLESLLINWKVPDLEFGPEGARS